MEHKDEIIEMALSDKVPFETIKELYGLDENQVNKLMQSELRKGSYRAWRRRVEKFSRQRSVYK
ncbi:MAG: TIGR03643 family protein [Candidatus Puniceispirillaceae bacterium]